MKSKICCTSANVCDFIAFPKIAIVIRPQYANLNSAAKILQIFGICKVLGKKSNLFGLFAKENLANCTNVRAVLSVFTTKIRNFDEFCGNICLFDIFFVSLQPIWVQRRYTYVHVRLYSNRECYE